ncbi:CHAD domain-containing protein [Luethyella okanaganae]|uniref:CHAD domain-containing protein n=1 Tax=Luethyella okanaganae TaxID=69372 RepID=A0ABW1VL36_9MICO
MVVAAGSQTPGTPAPDVEWPARELISDLAKELRGLEGAARKDRADAVHRMRSVSRRLRSALAALDAGPETPVHVAAKGLRWLGATLGYNRDSEVIQLRLQDHADGADDPAARRVARRLIAVERRNRGVTHAAVVKALGSKRYRRTMAALDAVGAAESPVGTADAREYAAAERLRSDLERVRRRARREAGNTDPLLAERKLHSVRKAARRLRYDAEAAAVDAPGIGVWAASLAAAAERVQHELGAFRDSALVQELVVASSAGSGERSGEAAGDGRGAQNDLLRVERTLGEAALDRARAAIAALLAEG